EPAPWQHRVDSAVSETHISDLGEQDIEIFLFDLELAKRSRNFGGRDARRPHLVEQRLEYVVVPPVDQEDVGIRMSQGPRRRQTGKASADDQYELASRVNRIKGGRCLLKLQVILKDAHRVTCIREVESPAARC